MAACRQAGKRMCQLGTSCQLSRLCARPQLVGRLMMGVPVAADICCDFIPSADTRSHNLIHVTCRMLLLLLYLGMACSAIACTSAEGVSSSGGIWLVRDQAGMPQA